jgi:hypothetical protein
VDSKTQICVGRVNIGDSSGGWGVKPRAADKEIELEKGPGPHRMGEYAARVEGANTDDTSMEARRDWVRVVTCEPSWYIKKIALRLLLSLSHYP